MEDQLSALEHGRLDKAVLYSRTKDIIERSREVKSDEID